MFESRWASVGVAAPARGASLRLESCRLVLSHLTELFLVNGFCCRVCVSVGRLVSFRECVSLPWEIKAPQCWHGLSGYYWSNPGWAVTARDPAPVLLHFPSQRRYSLTDQKSRLNPDSNQQMNCIRRLSREISCVLHNDSHYVITTRNFILSEARRFFSWYNYRFCNAAFRLQREEETLRHSFFSPATASFCLLVVRN